MKLNTSSPSSQRKKLLLLIASGFVFLLILLTIFLYTTRLNIFGWNPFITRLDSSIDQKTPSNEQIDAGNEIKKETIGNSSSKSSQNATPSDQRSVNIKNDIPVVISSMAVFNKTLKLRADLDVITNDGSCTLTLISGGTTITKESGVQALTKTSTCKGFDVDLSPGDWKITLEFISTDYSGKAEGSVLVQ